MPKEIGVCKLWWWISSS